MKELPQSVLTKNQKKVFDKVIDYNGRPKNFRVTLRYDDECGNGHNSFSITGEIKNEIYGCCHDEIAKYFPELAHLIKWHLFDSTGPLHYVSNSLYHASDKDWWGLRKGEVRQLRNGKTGELCWELKAIHKVTKEVKNLYEIKKQIDSNEKPESEWDFDFLPWERIGEGKEPDLEAARNCSLWFDAELADFTKENLEKRLPDLVWDFKQVIESIGFIF